ncbi:hypothetical protein [Pseudocitrobacter corydidari]
MDIISKLMAVKPFSLCFDQEYDAQFRRLQLLENGVRNYAGGIDALRLSVGEAKVRAHNQDREIESLLATLEGYLVGIKALIDD